MDVVRMKARRLLFAALLLVAAPAARAGMPSSFDHDGDGYDDATEIANGYTPYGPGRLYEHDADGDGLSDGYELDAGTDPLLADSDGDGYDDALELSRGYDPRDPSPVKAKKRIVISIAKQELTSYQGSVIMATHPVSTGRPGHPTPIGTFAILDKIPRAWSASAKLWMPYWMPFIGTKYGLHELPEWPGGVKEGEEHLGTPVSGGCVRLGVGAARELYDWAEIGTEVVINRT